jgi:hypothetical protein
MPLDDADKTAIEKMIADSLKGDTLAQSIGGAVKAAVSGLKLEDAVKTQVADAVKAAQPGPDKGKGDDKGKGAGKGDDKVDERIAAMEKRIAEERAAREKAEAAQKADALHGAAQAALVAAGVPGERVKHAMAYLLQEGLLEADENGAPSMKGADGYGIEGLQPLKEAIPKWLETSDGKAYLPPRNVQGTGEGSQRPNLRGSDGKVDAEKAKDLAKSKILGAARLL